MTNKELIKRYPWLTPFNRFSGKLITDCAGPNGEEGFWPGSPTEHPDYNYDFTELDNLPDGWRKAFGERMCEEIRKALIKNNCLNDYYVAEIKEEYGGLRWYDYGAPAEVEEIIKKYTQLSYYTCIDCGQPATKISKGWNSPFCDKCAKKLDDYMKFENIEEVYYNE